MALLCMGLGTDGLSKIEVVQVRTELLFCNRNAGPMSCNSCPHLSCHGDAASSDRFMGIQTASMDLLGFGGAICHHFPRSNCLCTKAANDNAAAKPATRPVQPIAQTMTKGRSP